MLRIDLETSRNSKKKNRTNKLTITNLFSISSLFSLLLFSSISLFTLFSSHRYITQRKSSQSKVYRTRQLCSNRMQLRCRHDTLSFFVFVRNYFRIFFFRINKQHDAYTVVADCNVAYRLQSIFRRFNTIRNTLKISQHIFINNKSKQKTKEKTKTTNNETTVVLGANTNSNGSRLFDFAYEWLFSTLLGLKSVPS